MSTAEDLSLQLRSVDGTFSVDEVSRDTFRIILPLGPLVHDSIVLSLEKGAGEWLVSDAGMIGFLVGDDLDQLADVLQCAGAPFELEDGRLVASVTSSESVPGLVRSFAHYVAGAPLVWHSLECARLETSSRTVPSSHLMAREARADIVDRVGSRYQPVIRVNHLVGGRARRTPAPLAIATPTGTTVKLVASFIDTTAAKGAVTAAERATSFLFDVLAGRPIEKFVVVRGDASSLDRFGELYEHEQATVVSTEGKGRFVDAAVQAAHELVDSPS